MRVGDFATPAAHTECNPLAALGASHLGFKTTRESQVDLMATRRLPGG